MTAPEWEPDPDQMSLPLVVGCTTTPATGLWNCPMCGTSSPPRETPAGTYCTGPCRQKLETCCEGAPLPPKEIA